MFTSIINGVSSKAARNHVDGINDGQATVIVSNRGDSLLVVMTFTY